MKKKEQKEERESIADLIKKINDEFGPGAAITLDSAPRVDVDVISTGSFSLDRALGVGGFPRGRIIEIFGPESSGKTTLALSTIAQVQKTGGRGAYIDVENAMDPEYAKKIGVNISELILSQPDGAEEALQLIERFLKAKSIDVIVLDSVAALVPKTEYEGDIGNSYIGLQARLMSQALRKLTGLAKEANAIVIFINQIRMKVNTGPFAGNPETTPGGKAMGFYSSVRLDIRRIAKLQEGESIVGNRVKVKVVKNKVAPPFRTTEFPIMFGKGIDREMDVFETAEREKLISKEGHTYYYATQKMGVGIRNAIETLRSSKEMQKEIENKLSHNEVTQQEE